MMPLIHAANKKKRQNSRNAVKTIDKTIERASKIGYINYFYYLCSLNAERALSGYAAQCLFCPKSDKVNEKQERT